MYTIQTQFSCEKCNASYVYKKGLNEHVRSKHGEQSLCFQCPKCIQTFTTPYNLIHHMNDIHKLGLELKDARSMERVVEKGKRFLRLLYSLGFF